MSIQAGKYRGRAVAGSEQYGQTKNGNDQIAIDLDLETGERVSTFLFFSEKAAKYSIQRLRALGWQGSDLADLSGIDLNDVDVEISYDEWEGKQTMKVNIVTGGTVTLDKPLDDKGKRAFAAKFKGLAASMAGAKPANGATKGETPF